MMFDSMRLARMMAFAAALAANVATGALSRGGDGVWTDEGGARFADIAPLAGARASKEYHAPDNFGAKSYRAIDVARGAGPWRSAGKNSSGKIPEAPISDVNHQWIAISWDEPRTIAALSTRDNFTDLRIDVFDGPQGIHPLAALGDEWRMIPAKAYSEKRADGRIRWITFDPPLVTAGLRLRVHRAATPQGADSPVAELDELHVFSPLADGVLPETAEPPPPPAYTIPVEVPCDGFLTVAIDDASGRRVRNLVAREPVSAGTLDVRWDLADEHGRTVEPGAYSWKAIASPPLELSYEFTVYPNTSQLHPENSAWLNGHDGPGGWLADHTPPCGACSAGDRVFFGASVPESGVGFAACDLSGRKLWGIHSFAAWSGGRRMATDGRHVFVEHGGSGHYGAADEGADRIWSVDIETHEWKQVYQAQQSASRRRGATGIAARDGLIALAVDAGPAMMLDACGWETVDIANCDPTYREPRKPRFPYEIVPDPRGDFLRLLRLKGDPPGYGHPNGAGLIDLPSTLGPEPRQHTLVAFREPVPFGSCVVPLPQDPAIKVRVSILKPDAPYPPDPGDRSQWIDLERTGGTVWDVLVAPENAVTRALLITYSQDDDDEIGDMLAERRPAVAPDSDDLLDIGADGLSFDAGDDAFGTGSGHAWSGSIEGLRMLRRRLANRAADAEVIVNSGAVSDDGVWTASRDTPLSREDPAVYAMVWDEPRPLCGLAVKEVDGERTEVDVFTGDPAARPDPAADAGWTQVAAFTSRRRMDHSGFEGHNALARYLDEMVDFGSNIVTRAVRLRVVSQFTADTHEGSCAKDRLGLDPTRCRIFGVAPLEWLGGEKPVDGAVAQRIEILDGETGALAGELPAVEPRDLAFAPDGALYAVSAGRVVRYPADAMRPGADGRIPPSGENPAVALDIDVTRPGPIACDSSGNLYVFDAAPERSIVRVFAPDGTHIRDIGEPGGYSVGPWNPNRMQALAAIAVDSEGKLWCVDSGYWPKRVSCWGADGSFLHEVLGPTEYGGAGVLDPGDRSRLFYGPLEFELDWEHGTSRLKNLTWQPADGWSAAEVPVRTNGLNYMVTRAKFAQQRAAVVYIYERDHLRRVAALGAADAFAPLRAQAIHALVDFKPLRQFSFVWTDRDGDGEVSPDECGFAPALPGALSDFSRDLSICAGSTRFSVTEFLPDGAPVFRAEKLPLTDGLRDGVYRLANGCYYHIGDGPEMPDTAFAPDGSIRWSYPNEGSGVGSDRTCGPYYPGQVVCQFGMAGHETPDGGDLGEFFAIHSNFGAWNIWTADGLLAGRIFRDLRDAGRVAWSMPEHERGMRLDDVTLGQEHFQAYLSKDAATGDFYAVAGHNHASVVKIGGLDRFVRLGGAANVDGADIEAAQAWRRETALHRSRGEPRVIDCFDCSAHGASPDWASLPVASLPADTANPGRSVSFQFCHDSLNLYARFVAKGAGPFKNSGMQWDRLFKTGAAVDLMIGLDDGADPRRRAPVKGDMRILAAIAGDGAPVVAMYNAVAPEADPDARREIVSPVAKIVFDEVKRVEGAALAHSPIYANQFAMRGEIVGYTVELTIPMASIGMAAEDARRIRFDWGILETDATGASVLRRSYWSNAATSTLADAPSEARLEPDLWGWALIQGRDRGTATLGDPASMLDDARGILEDFELDDF